MILPELQIAARRACTRFADVHPQASEAKIASQNQGPLPQREENDCSDQGFRPQREGSGAKSRSEETGVDNQRQDARLKIRSHDYLIETSIFPFTLL